MSLLRTAFVIILVLFLCSNVWADTHTAIASGKWLADAATVWSTKDAPANTDTVVIPDTFDVEYDEDMSGWANGVTLTINAGGTLHACEDAGTYYLKCQANLTVNGILQAGTSVAVPLPLTSTFTIAFTGNFGISVAAAGKLYLYCTEPAIKYIKLLNNEDVGSTVLEVDTNITGDIWADGDEIRINNIYSGYNTTVPSSESRIIAVGGRAAGAITITAGLTSKKSAGSYVALVNRNVKILTPSTTNQYAITMNAATTGCYINMEINGSGTGSRGIYSGVSNTISGVISGLTSFGISSSVSSTINCIIISCNYAVISVVDSTVNDLIIGCVYGTNGTVSVTFSSTNIIAGCTYGVYTCQTLKLLNLFDGNQYAIYQGISHIVNCIFTNNQYDIRYGDNYIIYDTIFGTSTNLSAIYGGKAYNCTFNGTEFSLYNSSSYRGIESYFESFNHDQIENVYKAWCLGGIITSQTVSPPSGYTIWYEHACESADYPCFRQFQTNVLPGTAIEVEGLIRIADGEDLSVNPPALQIIDYFADPLSDETQEPLDECEIPEPNGGVNNGWQEVSVIWANQGNSPRIVLVRMFAQHATADVDEVWSIADYQDQIAAIYNKLPTNYIMGSSDVDNHDTDIDAILVDTGTTIPATLSTTDGKIDTVDETSDNIWTAVQRLLKYVFNVSR